MSQRSSFSEIRRNRVLINILDKDLVLVIAWFGGQLRINFLSKILKFFCNYSNLTREINP